MTLTPEFLRSLGVEQKRELLALLEERDRRRRGQKILTYFPETGPLRRELYPKHLRFFALGGVHEPGDGCPEGCDGSPHRERLALAANRVGKALKHGTRVATPSGWVAIEELRVGDRVFSGDGTVTVVTGVYPQGEVPLFSLLMDGSLEITACAQHRWLYKKPCARYPMRHSHGRYERNPSYGVWSVGNTEDLSRFGFSTRQRPVIPMTRPWQMPRAVLPIDPYVMGALLGDGGFTGKSVKFSTADVELLQAVAHIFTVRHYGAYDYGVNGAVGAIRALGLSGHRSEAKFIPSAYLRASIQQRLDLLCGLMDTDGYVCAKNGAMEYTTTSRRLAEDFCWLCTSLGIKTRCLLRQTHAQNGAGLPSYRIGLRTGSLCPFKLERKRRRWRALRETNDWVVHGVHAGRRGPATCIEVSHPSHTYVIEGGVVTHNTESIGGYELTLHLTGDYPAWWPGVRFSKPVDTWAVGETRQTTRDILQKKLLGVADAHDAVNVGTGLIPADKIVKCSPMPGVPGAVEQVQVRHASGGTSLLGFKSYDQGRESFQGTEKDVILLDEECPLQIYTECLTRTMTVGGHVLSTFTPLRGLTPLVVSFLESKNGTKV